jgi:hypothetical protein
MVMTDAETADYDSADEITQRAMWTTVKARALAIATETGQSVEVHTADGITVEVIEPPLP